MNITPNTTKPELKSIKVELTPEEAVATLVIVGSIGHDDLNHLLNVRLDHNQKVRLRELSTTPLWEGLKAVLLEHGLGGFEVDDLDKRERLNLQYLGVLD